MRSHDAGMAMSDQPVEHDQAKPQSTLRTTLPRGYASEEVFEAEVQRIFLRQWTFVAHESQVPVRAPTSPTRSPARASSSCVMTHGALHALLNICRHRGHRLCEDAQRIGRRFVCPYHQWTYDSTDASRTSLVRRRTLDHVGLGTAPRPRRGLAWARVRVARGLGTAAADTCARWVRLGHDGGPAGAPQGSVPGVLRDRRQLEDPARELSRVLPLPQQSPGVVRVDGARRDVRHHRRLVRAVLSAVRRRSSQVISRCRSMATSLPRR